MKTPALLRRAQMRILFLTEQMEIGGTQTELLSLCKELQRLHHYVVIASNGGRLTESIRKLGITHYALPSWTGRKAYSPMSIIGFPWCVFRLVQIVKKERFNIVHAYYSFPLLFGSLVCRILGVPLVVTLNDGILDCRSKLVILRSSGILKYAAKIIVISAEMERYVSGSEHHDERESETVIVPNALDFDVIDSTVASDKSELGFSASSRIVLWVGRLARDKIDAIKNLINSAPAIVREVPEARILVVGQGPKYDEVRRLADRINEKLGSKVVIMVRFFREIFSVIRSADIVVGMGKVAIEGMACWKPVIVVGHIVGQFGGNFGGVVTKESSSSIQRYNYSGRDSRIVTTPSRISEACIRLLKDERYLRTVGDFGRQLVVNMHDAKLLAKRVDGVYREAVARIHSEGQS